MNFSSPGKAGLFALVFAIGLASTAQAQQQITQTLTWTPTNQTGWTGGLTYLCYQNDRYLGYNAPTSMTFTWTDTTTAPVGAVRIDVNINSHYWYTGLNFQFAVNGVNQTNVLTTTTQNTVCGTNQLFTRTFETGITVFNAGATNTVTMTQTSGAGYFGFNPNTTYMVQFVITQLNLAPFSPTVLSQVGPDSQGINIGGTCFGTSMTLRSAVTDPDDDQVYLEAEFQPISVFFTGTPTHTGNPVNSGTTATVDLINLAAGSYHWRVRTVDPLGFRSAWVSFGNNSEIVADVVVDPNVVAIQTGTAEERKEGGDCDMSVGAGPGTLIPSFLAAALMAFGLARRRR